MSIPSILSFPPVPVAAAARRRTAAAACLLALASALPACSDLALHAAQPEVLATAAPLAVSGYRGWRPGLAVRFGGYATGARENGPLEHQGDEAPLRWGIGPYERELAQAWATAARRVAFLQHGPDGDVQVRLMSRLASHEEAWLTRWFGIPTAGAHHASSSFTLLGTVEPLQAGRAAWRFGLWEDDASPGALEVGGWAEDDQGHRIDAVPIREFDRPAPRPAGLPPPLLGTRFEVDGRAVASLDLTGDGAVRFRDDLPAEQRLVVAALCSATMMRETMASAR